MTQSPQSGQTAPRTTDLGSVTTPRHPSGYGNSDFGPPWGTASTSGTTANRPDLGAATGPPTHADAPTESVPLVQNLTPSPPSGPQSGDESRAFRTARPRGPRRARLQLRHINAWTVLKFSCVLSIALFFVWLIVVGVLFGILDAAGIIDKVNDTVVQLNGPGSDPPITPGIVFGGAAIVGVVNVVLFIALSTVGSVVYNLCADLVGGVEITLSER